MKDEIKDLFEKLKDNLGELGDSGISTTLIFKNEIKLIENCINNLQEENKILKENAIHNDKVVDKANEIIDEALFIGVKDYRSQLEIVQNILQGSDKE